MPVAWVIGVAESCDLRVDSPYVSGRHCRLERVAEGWVLEDLGSTNGTFINGARLTGRAAVSRSDHITLGRSTLLPWPQEAADGPAGAARPMVSPAQLRLPRDGETCVIGRSHDCDIVLDFPMVSSRHASIRRTAAGWVVKDLGSTNGTFVGSSRISSDTPVRSGDVVGLGSYRLVLAAGEQCLEEEDLRGAATVELSNVAVDVAGRRLVGDVSLGVRHGELIGVMGGSGAGKSTLLSTIVGVQRLAEGSVTITGLDVHTQPEQLRGQVGYVPQDDIMHTDLTVEQALWYSARLRLPRDYDDDEIRTRVMAVINQLGLTGTESTRIGSAERRGISGGQRKRVNVAMEMITDPPVLVLDEPTSGLSSIDALTLIQQLRRLADAGKTIILTIHQPGSEILRLLNAIAVLARDDSTNSVGRLVWYGPAYPEAARFFEPSASVNTTGLDAEAVLRGLSTRPADYWERAYKSSPTYTEMVASRLTPHAAPATQPSDGITLSEVAKQFRVLVRRMLAVKVADRWSIVMLFIQAPAIALLVAGVFGAKATAEVTAASWASVANAVAMTTFLLALAAIWFGCSNAIRELVDERAIYRRERMVGLSPIAYLGSKVFVFGIICAVQCVILLLVGTLGCGLVGSKLYASLTLMLAAGVGTTMGLAVSALANSPATATALLPVIVLPLVVLGGVLVPVADLSYSLGVLADLSPSRWAFEALLGSEADARPLLSAPDAAKPWVSRPQDMAQPWFPRAGWRSGATKPLVMLAMMWVMGLGGVYAWFIRRER